MMRIMRNSATKRAENKRDARNRILDAAARRLREEGLDGTAIVPVMRFSEARLTRSRPDSHSAQRPG